MKILILWIVNILFIRKFNMYRENIRNYKHAFRWCETIYNISGERENCWNRIIDISRVYEAEPIKC